MSQFFNDPVYGIFLSYRYCPGRDPIRKLIRPARKKLGQTVDEDDPDYEDEDVCSAEEQEDVPDEADIGEYVLPFVFTFPLAFHKTEVLIPLSHFQPRTQTSKAEEGTEEECRHSRCSAKAACAPTEENVRPAEASWKDCHETAY